MRELLAPYSIDLLVYDLPHFNGTDECLHLLSLISLVDTNLAVVYRPLIAAAFNQELENRGVTLIDVPDDEFGTQGTNVLALAPRDCLLLEENTITAERLREAGCIVRTYEGLEISHNRTGGPTCLTRPILRDRDR